MLVAIESGLYTPDEITLMKIEMGEIAAKLGVEGLTPPERGRPRTKAVLRGDELREWERLQREGKVHTVDYSAKATMARAKARLAAAPEIVENSNFALEQMTALAEDERKREEARKEYEEKRDREAEGTEQET